MKWKIERWLSEVFPGRENVYSAYRHLTRRELAIVSAGVLDVALAELLSRRLLAEERECIEFLGANEDGRAPCGSFGARIQLSVLLGIITPQDAAVLRTIKNLRNRFAHRINVDFTSESVKPLVQALFEQTTMRTKPLFVGDHVVGSKGPREAGFDKLFETEPEAGAGWLLATFCVYQAYFHLLSDRIPRIELVPTNDLTDRES